MLEIEICYSQLYAGLLCVVIKLCDREYESFKNAFKYMKYQTNAAFTSHILWLRHTVRCMHTNK